MKCSAFFELTWQGVNLGLNFQFFWLILVWFLRKFKRLIAADGFADLETKAIFEVSDTFCKVALLHWAEFC
jgi:hypothetical protein